MSAPTATEEEVGEDVERGAVVRAVVLSDIHAAVEPGSEETHVAQNAHDNALTAARAYLAEQVRRANMVLCPGDLIHRGQAEPMEWVWRELHGVAQDLGATLIGSVGNHDLLQKPTGGQEPEQTLRALDPPFPNTDDDCVSSYWAHHFGAVQTGTWRVISLDTCCRHGGFDPDEAQHGRLMPYSLPRVKAFLKVADRQPAVNICMLHHHPQEWSHGGEHKTQHLLGGDVLIDLLEDREERWLLLHGHKHFPAVGYFGHSSRGPIRVAAASVGINLLPDTGVEVRNQMHVIDFAVEDGSRLGLAMAGEIRSYTWDRSGEWAPAAGGGGLASVVGFGYRRDGHDLARDLRNKAQAAGRGVYVWAELVDHLEPRARYLSPLDRQGLLRAVVAMGGGVHEDEQEGFLEVTFP